MSIKISNENVKETKEMRAAMCETIMALAEKNEDIVYLDADLSSAGGMTKFTKQYPERTFNVGIAEANLIGTAAGLSATGKIPFAHTFAPFASRRCYDQIFLSCAYAKANVKIIGTDPGVTAAFNGGTHMPFEDVGILRTIPTMTIVEPTDTTMLKDLFEQISGIYGVHYIRVKRKNAIKIYDEGSTFEIGKAVKLKDGSDVTIIACGIMVDEARKAAEILETEGVSVRVLDMFTIKPIDRDAVISAAKDTGAIVTCENHNIINGLGSAVAEVLTEEYPVPMERIGVQDIFGEVGSEDYLRKRFNLTADDIVAKAKKVIARKK